MYNAHMKILTTNEIESIKHWLGTGSINIFGLPFAGKDTHGHKLAELFDASIMGGGDILRNSAIPPRVHQIMVTGALIPTNDYIDIVVPYLSKEEFAGRPLVLSSVGRWHGEEQGVISAAEAANHPIKAALFLSVSEATAYQRFVDSANDENRGERSDDTDDVLKTRFSEFRNKTMPVIDFYRDQGILIEIDGNPPKNEVHQSILRGLLSFASSI